MFYKLIFSVIFVFLFFSSSYAYPPPSVRLPYDAEIALADLDFKRAKEFDDSAKYQKSIYHYELAAKDYEKHKIWKKYTDALIFIGYDHLKLNKFKEAKESINKAISVTIQYLDTNSPGLASVYSNLGLCYYYEGNYDTAILSFTKALKSLLNNDKKKHEEEAKIYGNMGLVFKDQGDFSKALKFNLKSLKIMLANFGKNHLNVASAYENVGLVYKAQSFFVKALNYYQKALKIRLKILGKNHRLIATTYSNIGNIYGDLRKSNKALDYYHKSVKILMDISNENHPDLSTLYNNIGLTYWEIEDNYHALEYCQRALKIRLAVYGNQSLKTSITYNNIGLMYEYQGDFTQALNYFNKVLNIRVKILGENHPLTANAYENIGSIYYNRANYDRALEYDMKALKVNLKIFGKYHSKIVKIYGNIGNTYAAQKHFSNALSYYQKALNICNTSGVYDFMATTAYAGIGNIYNLQGNYDLALFYYQKTFSILVAGFNNLSIYANPKLKGINSKPELLDQLFKKSVTAEKLHQQTQSLKDLKLAYNTAFLAADLIDSMRNDNLSVETKRDLAKNSVKIYETGIRTARKIYQLTGKEDYLFKAFNITERSKSYLLLQSLKETEAKSFANIPDSLLEQERDLKIEIAFYEKQLFEAESEKDSVKVSMYQNYLFDKKTTFRQLTEQLEKEFPDYYRLKYNTRVASVKEVRDKLIDDHTAFLEYFWGDSAVYIFTITKNKITVDEIKNVTATKNKIDSLRSFLTTSPRAEKTEDNKNRFTALSRELYQILLPKLDSLKKIKKLIVIPDGPLSYLSFDVLLTQEPTSKTSYSTLPYLIQSYDLSYGYSATLVQNHAKKESKNDNLRVLAFAPSYESSSQDKLASRGALRTLRGESYGALPGAQQEVRKLSNYLEGEFCFGNTAKESYFKEKAGNYGIIHLAMHGKIDDEQPMNSKLIFSQQNSSKEDGLLHVHEIYNLNLNAELVVLSACQTGTGRYIQGEGIMSLARGFMYAGAGSVVLTLWDADDKVSAQLTEIFYKSLYDGKQKDNALRQAKLNYLQHTNDRMSHPFFWAAFVSTGDVRPLPLKKDYSLWVWLIACGSLFLTGAVLLIRKKSGRG